MGANQLLLIVGALVLLITVQLSINSTIIRAYEYTLDGEATIDAVSVGQAMIDEINTKSFDETTVAAPKFFVTDLTQSGSLGRDGGETLTLDTGSVFLSKTLFDDIDDYNGYTRKVKSPTMDYYTVQDSIFYVTDNDPSIWSSTRTFYKRIEVKVTHPNLLFPVKVTSLYAYRRYF
jgi:hypothetical protein